MKKQFKSESKRLLDLMINSIYTNKDIFLRELISNASDAIDKLYYRSLTDKGVTVSKENLEINIEIDEEKRTLTILDNGCGMTDSELENHLGTIAKSGSLAFKENMDKKKDVDIIGQFGVGFYSAFMVSDKIEVLSKSLDSEEAFLWTSSGADGYTIEKSSKDEMGTKIILYIKDDEEHIYDHYLDEYYIKELIKKYSDYIRYPIKMEVTHHELVDKENNKYEDRKVIETINTMVPLWKKKSSEVSDEEYANFYMDKFNDYDKPQKVISSSVEGATTYKALLFIPAHTPYDYYTKDYEKGLSLYASGVLIMEKCAELLPDYYNFVKGVVDSEDLSLNISREILQQDKTLKTIAKSIETKITKELTDMLKNERETYEKFFTTFGTNLKFGVYDNFGANKDKLKDLLMFISSKTKKLITLKEYVENNKDSDSIYYCCGETIDKIDNLPLVENYKDKDIEILYCTDYMDEFVLQTLMNYNDKKFVNISTSETDLSTDAEKEKLEKHNESSKDLFKTMQEAIPEVSTIRFTNKLKKHPVCLSSKGNVSIEMEKVINAMPTDEKLNAEKVLEINENHEIVKKLENLQKENKEELKKYTKILYAQARLIEGLPIENPTEVSSLICEVLSK